MKVYAFDRDCTVSTGEPPGPVPLALVVKLKQVGHEVWSCGNLNLVEEAGIPGYAELGLRFAPGSIGRENRKKERREMLARLVELFPDATRIVVDDIDLSDVPGWQHYFPQQFLELWEKGAI